MCCVHDSHYVIDLVHVITTQPVTSKRLLEYGAKGNRDAVTSIGL